MINATIRIVPRMPPIYMTISVAVPDLHMNTFASIRPDASVLSGKETGAFAR
jgi:hypothetical protein